MFVSFGICMSASTRFDCHKSLHGFIHVTLFHDDADTVTETWRSLSDVFDADADAGAYKETRL